MRKKLGRVFIVGLLILIVLLPIPVGKRVTSIDFGKIYPGLQDYFEGREGTVLDAGRYPNPSKSTYFRLQTHDNAMMLYCMLEDSHGWIQSRRQWYKGPPSHPMGEETFFRNETGSPGTLRLTFRRYNVEVDFGLEHPRFSNNHLYFSNEDIQMLEQAAAALDKAILQKSSGVHVETVHFYQKLILIPQGIALLIFLLLMRCGGHQC